jgi:hypothetical protein
VATPVTTTTRVAGRTTRLRMRRPIPSGIGNTAPDRLPRSRDRLWFRPKAPYWSQEQPADAHPVVDVSGIEFRPEAR